MCRCRMGNPKRSSRFICCKCLKENQLGSGIQRSNQRSKYHIKNLTCINPGCNGDITKNIEVRYCDSFDELMQKAEELHRELYIKEDIIMKKLYFVETNGYNMLVSVDKDKNCRYLTETDEFPYIVNNDVKGKEQKALEFLESIEDDSSWDDDCSYEQIFEEFPVDVIAEIEKEL